MNLMLAFLIICVAFGLLAPGFGRREHLLVAALATAVTGLYFVFSARFM